MEFRQWLESSCDLRVVDVGPTDGLIGAPTTAGTYAMKTNRPKEYRFLQLRWKKESEAGRPFINLDLKDFLNRGFVSIRGAAVDKPWEPGDVGAPQSPIPTQMQFIGVGKDSKTPYIIPDRPNRALVCDLDRLFGDKPSGKWAKIT